MRYILPQDRTQAPLFVGSLEEQIDPNNEVRLIDSFVNELDFKQLGFKVNHTENGRPAYHPSTLLKLFLYGYLNSIRSSRVLEKECSRNSEVKWLLGELKPDHNTISNFRRDNSDAIRGVFQETVATAKNFGLIGGQLIAGDSTKLRAQNSKKNNYNPKKIERHLAYIQNKLQEYEAMLAVADGDAERQALAQNGIAKQQAHQAKYEALSAELERTGQEQISTTDPDSRQLITRNNITEVGYNVQSTVDAKHNIPIDYLVTNTNDSKAMGQMLERSIQLMGAKPQQALYDKGYHTGSEFKKAHELGIEVFVAIPAVASHAPNLDYDVEHFEYRENEDTYRCPAGQLLQTNGRWYNKDRGKSRVQVKHYKTEACKSCLFQAECTTNKKGRLIERPENAELVEANRKRMENHKELYRRRQAIVEHPYGVIKRNWGFSYVLTKRGIERASSDVGLMFLAYNLRRLFNLMPEKLHQNKPKAWTFTKWQNCAIANFNNSILNLLPFDGKIYEKILIEP